MKKKHLAALLSALVIPGAGQLYSRHFVKGAAFLAASAAIIAALMYKTMDAALSAASGASMDELSGSLLPIVQRVADSNRGFYGAVSLVFLVVWVAGIIDAWVSGSGEKIGKI